MLYTHLFMSAFAPATRPASTLQANKLMDSIKQVPSLPQRQDSSSAQILDLMQVALQLGLTRAVLHLETYCGATQKEQYQIHPAIQKVVTELPAARESRASLGAQLRAARVLANRLGLYDASDAMRNDLALAEA